MTIDPNHLDALDRATSARLAKLAGRPVDTLRLERKLRCMLEVPLQQPALRRRIHWGQLSAWTGIAAAIIVFATVSMWPGSQNRVEASPVQMFQIHDDMISGRIAVTPTDDEAILRQLIWSQQTGTQAVALLPQDIAHSCCFQKVGGKPVVGMLWHTDTGDRIAIAISDDHQLRPDEQQKTLTVAGRTFTTHHRDGVNMAMITANNRMLCFMSNLPAQQLAELATQVLDQPQP